MKAENLLGLVAALFTIANTLIAVAFNIKFEAIPQPDYELPSMLIKVLFFGILELSISFTFAFLILKVLQHIKNGAARYPSVIFLGLFSAWTTLFNVKWIFLNNIEGAKFFVIYGALAFLANGLFALLYFHHTFWRPQEKQYQPVQERSVLGAIKFQDSFFFHGLALIFVMALEYADSYF